MKKTCTKCKKEKSLEDFAFKNKAKNIRRACCKECISVIDKERYYKDLIAFRKKRNKEVKARHVRNMKYIIDFLKRNPCIDCGENNFICLDFDHKNQKNKTENISMLSRCASIERIQKEIDKCDVRCANCHRIRTAKQFGYYKYL